MLSVLYFFFTVPLMIAEIVSPVLYILKKSVSECSVENVQSSCGQILFNTLQYESTV